MIDNAQSLFQLIGKSAARHGITSLLTILAVHLSLHFQSIYLEFVTTFVGSLLAVVLMVVWSWLEKKAAVQMVTRYVKAALMLESGASMERVVALARQTDATVILADKLQEPVTTVVTAIPEEKK